MGVHRKALQPPRYKRSGNNFVLGFFLGFCLGVTLGAQRGGLQFPRRTACPGDDILPTGLFGIVEQRSDGDFAVGC